MRSSKKVITIFMVVLTLAMLATRAFAVNDESVEAGKSVTVTFTFTDIYNIDGQFTVNDPQKIISSYAINVADSGSTAAVVNGDRLWASPMSAPVKTTVSVQVTLRIKSSADVGANCTVSFSGIYGDANEELGNEHEITQSATVTVRAASATSGDTPAPTASVDPSGDPVPTNTPTPSPSVSPSSSSEPAPTGSAIDYSELQKQINIASGLIVSDYTNESQKLLQEALSAASKALDSQEQKVVTAAAEELRSTISSLVLMDYSALKVVLAKADTLLDSEEIAMLWQQLSDAAEKGSKLLQSGDQQAVDQAVEELSDILSSISVLIDAEPGTKVVIQEVPVEVLPNGDYCNVEKHLVWPVLLVVSVALNVMLVGVIAYYVIRRTRNRRDDTPLVDYDIDDDY